LITPRLDSFGVARNVEAIPRRLRFPQRHDAINNLQRHRLPVLAVFCTLTISNRATRFHTVHRRDKRFRMRRTPYNFCIAAITSRVGAKSSVGILPLRQRARLLSLLATGDERNQFRITLSCAGASDTIVAQHLAKGLPRDFRVC